MSFIRRILYITLFAAVALFAIDNETRTIAKSYVHDGYALVAGRTLPTPLERPPLLTVELGDCLRGNGQIESDNAYAEFCADLASFAGPVVAAANAPPLMPVRKPARKTVALTRHDRDMPPAQESDDGKSGGDGGDREQAENDVAAIDAPAPMPAPAAVAATPREECLVDANGSTSKRIDGVWVKAPPHDRDGAAQDMRGGKSSRIVTVPDGCDVASPTDAKVLYAGPFKGYLGVVILDTGKTERLTVAGLGEVFVRRGDSVVRGAKIGSTSQGAAPALANASNDGAAALLYVEEVAAAQPAS